MSSRSNKLGTLLLRHSDQCFARRSYHRLVMANISFGKDLCLLGGNRTQFLPTDMIVSSMNNNLMIMKPFASMMFSTSVESSPIIESSEISNISPGDSKRSEPRTMPTRHSRHHYPPVAPLTDLQQVTDEFLTADPGSLFVYDPSKNLTLTKVEQYEEGLKVSDAWRKKVDFILRGYSALFPNSIVDLMTDDSVDEYTLEKIPSNTTERIYQLKHSHIPDEKIQPDLYISWVQKRNEVIESTQVRQDIITTMLQILERLELEANIYVNMWAKHKSNRMELAASRQSTTDDVHVSDDSSTINPSASVSVSTSTGTDSVISDDLTSDQTMAWALQTLTKSYGTPPGPSIHMYDLVLDTIAVAIQLGVDQPAGMIQLAKALQLRAIERYTTDVQAKMDIYNIIPTAPTTLTFNAVIRASALAKYHAQDIVLRDVAIDAAFTTFDIMYRQIISNATLSLGFQQPIRNSATYLYMLQTVEKYFPISPTRGNIVHSLFVKAALEEGVLDEVIIETLLVSISPSNVSHSHNFDQWVEGIRERYSKHKYGYGFPSKWSMNKRSRRYNKKIALY